MILPEKETHKFVRGLQSSSDPALIIHHLLGGLDARKRPSDFEAARAISTPTESRLEFELMVRHHLVYPKLIPAGASSARSQKSDELPLGEQDSSLFTSPEPLSSVRQPRANWPVSYSSQPLQGRGEPSRARASSTGEYCDNRLYSLQINYWTQVPISDRFAAAVLSLYLTMDHCVLGFFDVDLFLTDLIDLRRRFCSPFLLNSLMYLACVSIT
jgi:hypothetical protein